MIIGSSRLSWGIRLGEPCLLSLLLQTRGRRVRFKMVMWEDPELTFHKRIVYSYV